MDITFLENILYYAIVLVSRAAPTHVFVRVCRLFSVGDCRPNSVYPLDLHWHIVIVCIALSMQPMYVISCVPLSA